MASLGVFRLLLLLARLMVVVQGGVVFSLLCVFICAPPSLPLVVLFVLQAPITDEGAGIVSVCLFYPL